MKSPSSFPRSGAAILLVVFALVAAACGDSGTGRFAGLSVFESADGSFIVRYRKPPWKLRTSAENSVTLEIERLGASLSEQDAGLVGANYWLTANVVATDASACLDAALASKPTDATMMKEKHDAETAHGDKGVGATYRYPVGQAERYLRILCLTHSTGHALEVRLDSTVDPDDPEVDEMLAGIEIRTAEGS